MTLQISHSKVREISPKTACQTTLPAWYLDTMDMGLSRPLGAELSSIQNLSCSMKTFGFFGVCYFIINVQGVVFPLI